MAHAFNIVQIKVKPGRGAEAAELLQAIKQEVLAAGVLQVRLLAVNAGPTAPSITFASEFESLAALEASGPALQASPAYAAAQANTDLPADIIAQSIATEIE